MALKLSKKSTSAPAPASASAFNKSEHAADPAQKKTTISPPKAAATPAPSAVAKPAFLKTGKQSQEAFAKEETKAAAAKDRPFRFFLKNGVSTSITFLDGDLDQDGVLTLPVFYEHFVKIAGKPHNFVCTQDEEPCPICEGGDSPAFVGALTVIDHTVFTDKDGKERKDQIRLFVPKRTSMKLLQKLAEKRGGLRGCRFDVSRTGEKEASVGNVFDFTEKLLPAQIAKMYGEKAVPLEYTKALVYLSAKELRKLGFGTANTPIGAADSEDYDDKL